PAGICCWHSGPKRAVHEWPNNTFFGSYVAAAYGTESNEKEPYALKNNINPVVLNTDGSIVGYKYFNFDNFNGKNSIWLMLGMIPEGIDGKIEVFIDRPWAKQGGKLVGTLELTSQMQKTSAEFPIKLSGINDLKGKHAVYLVFSSQTKEKSLCTLETIRFAGK
ncbi:MAG: glycosyl hydrolase family 43, partial [Bacteroidales bacterium]|nr:glycosyl hydrolase family 43 [Bacteroidales bacterium]